MLLYYLYHHFLEENEFAEQAGLSIHDLQRLIEARVVPTASYVYTANARSVSFVSDHIDTSTYRFHLRGHLDWLRDVLRLSLSTEPQARQYFFARYDQAKAFLTSPLGQDLLSCIPNARDYFNAAHANMTWESFLSGVYGVCTRDSLPESVFLKQAGAIFVEGMVAMGDNLSAHQVEILRKAVDFLDNVTSDFAPHEVPTTSRQRCIVEVRARYFKEAPVKVDMDLAV